MSQFARHRRAESISQVEETAREKLLDTLIDHGCWSLEESRVPGRCGEWARVHQEVSSRVGVPS